MGFGRAGLYFLYELPNRLQLLGKRFRAVSGPGLKKVSLNHLYIEQPTLRSYTTDANVFVLQVQGVKFCVR